MKTPLYAKSIEKQVLEDFKEYVKRKHGKLHTVFGQEIELALKNHMALGSPVPCVCAEAPAPRTKRERVKQALGKYKELTRKSAENIIFESGEFMQIGKAKEFFDILERTGYLRKTIVGQRRELDVFIVGSGPKAGGPQLENQL